jgi:hypothetical protein
MKIGRNSSCPCGSGQKYKNCCARRSAPGFDFGNVAGVAVNRERKEILYVTKDILLNTLRRDSSLITDSFDRLHERDLKDMSELLGSICFFLYTGLEEARQKKELRSTMVQLLMNATNTFIAATTLLRTGFYFQAPILLRSLLETLATVLHLIVAGSDLQKFKDGNLSPKVILASAKKVLPPFGWLYGHLSESFVHIAPVHGQVQLVMPYDKSLAEPLKLNIRYLRMALWLIYVVTELTFVDVFKEGKYWKWLGGGKAEFNPSDGTRAWQKIFLMGEIPDV